MFGLFNRRRRFRNANQVKITDSIGASGDQFGTSVAIAKYNKTIAIGARYDDNGATANTGSVNVFTYNGTWNNETKIHGTNAGDQLGVSVSLSENGNTLLIGVPYGDSGATSNCGTALVYTRSGTTWSLEATLSASDKAANDEFGISVSLSNDGNTALIGAYYDAVGSNTNQGSAYVFTRSGTTWSEQQKLTDSGGAANDFFGFAVALSGDGDTALIGAYLDDTGGATTKEGSAVVFTRSGTTWSQQTKLTDSAGAGGDQFGVSVSLSNDGNTALVGSNSDTVGANTWQGSAVVFTRSGTTWSEQTKLTDSAGSGTDFFGHKVALSGDGNTALIASYNNDIGANTNQGSAIVFTRNNTTWTEKIKLTDSAGVAGDKLGFGGVALSRDGNIVVIGVPEDDVGSNADQGSAVVFYRR